MEPYMPPPVAIRRIIKNEVWQDDEYSDIEAKESEVEDADSDVDEPVYKPRAGNFRFPTACECETYWCYSQIIVDKECVYGSCLWVVCGCCL